MKKARKDSLNKPRSLSNLSAHYNNAIRVLELARSWPQRHSNIYKGNPVHRALAAIYHNKCAYCNQKPTGSPIQIEHFRPKNTITNVPNHTGYYWLGYEWTNLLFSCGTCNSKKGNHFQLKDENNRVSSPAWVNQCFDQNHHEILCNTLLSENNLLLNPEVDDLKKHLIYLPDGKLYHLSARGEHTIEKLGLNRDELYTNGRKHILDNLIDNMQVKLAHYTNGNRPANTVLVDIIDIVKSDILKKIEENSSFDDFLRVLFINYDEYITPRFPNQNHKMIIKWVFRNLSKGIKI